jgi:hypothetical protein
MADATAAALATYDDKQLACALAFMTRINQAATSAIAVLRETPPPAGTSSPTFPSSPDLVGRPMNTHARR